MIVLQSWAAVEAALQTPLDAGLKRILRQRHAQLSDYGDIARFVIVEPGCGFRGHRAQHSDLKARGIPK